MSDLLKQGGIMAVQTPMNYKEPIHRIIEEITNSEKWNLFFKNPRIFYNLTQNEYFDLLSDISSDFTLWETVYFHKMKSHSDIMEWYRSTGLRPYLNELSDNDKIKFENEIYKRLTESYPIQKNGEIIFRFPRFFFISVK
jgi:trans-aconitate 2-methyltransferase